MTTIAFSNNVADVFPTVVSNSVICVSKASIVPCCVAVQSRGSPLSFRYPFDWIQVRFERFRVRLSAPLAPSDRFQELLFPFQSSLSSLKSRDLLTDSGILCVKYRLSRLDFGYVVVGLVGVPRLSYMRSKLIKNLLIASCVLGSVRTLNAIPNPVNLFWWEVWGQSFLCVFYAVP